MWYARFMISQRTGSFESKMIKEIHKMNPVPEESEHAIGTVVKWQKCWEILPPQASAFIHH